MKKVNEKSSSGGNSLYFVLGSILVKTRSLEYLEETFNKVKNNYFKNPFSEIKYSLPSKVFKEKGMIKNYRHEVYSRLSESDCKLFACGQNKYTGYKTGIVKSKIDIYKLCFQHLFYLINSYMFKFKIKEPIVVFIDQKEEHHDDIMYQAYKEALRNTKLYPNFDSTTFAPTINVVNSKYTIGAQVADLVAGAIWRALEAEDKTYSMMIKKNFHSAENGDTFNFGYSTCSSWL